MPIHADYITGRTPAGCCSCCIDEQLFARGQMKSNRSQLPLATQQQQKSKQDISATPVSSTTVMSNLQADDTIRGQRNPAATIERNSPWPT